MDMESTTNLLDLIDQGLSVENDHLGPCVGDDDVPDGAGLADDLELGPCVGDDTVEPI